MLEPGATQLVYVLTKPDGTKIDEFDTVNSAREFAEFRVDQGDYEKVQCHTGLWHNILLPDNTFLVNHISDDALWDYPE